MALLDEVPDAHCRIHFRVYFIVADEIRTIYPLFLIDSMP